MWEHLYAHFLFSHWPSQLLIPQWKALKNLGVLRIPRAEISLNLQRKKKKKLKLEVEILKHTRAEVLERMWTGARRA